MSIPFETAVIEDLDTGYGTKSVSMPGGGSATGNKIHQGNIPAPSSYAGTVMVYPPTAYAGDGLVFAPDGTQISTAGSTTSGLQEAIDYACDNGYDLYVSGGGDHSIDSRQGAVVYNIDTGVTLAFPPMQGKTVRFGACTLNFSGASTDTADCVTFDSCLLVYVYFPGQIVSGRGGAMVRFFPETSLSLDLVAGTTIADSEFFIAHTVAIPDEAAASTECVVFDNSTSNVSGMTNARFHFVELNAGTSTGLLITTPSGTTSFSQNDITVQHLHGLIGTAWAVQVGTSSTTKIVNNRYRICISDATTTHKGISTYEQYAEYHLAMNSGISANGLVFQSSADQNLVIARQLTGGITDSSTTKRNVVQLATTRSNNSITVGASPYVYQNTSARDETVIVSNDGTVSLVQMSVDGVSYHTCATGPGAYPVAPGDRLKVTYAVVPTMRALRSGT